MKQLTREDRIAIAEKALDEGRIGQNKFRWREDGREMVCALSAFGPDIHRSSDCPADFMPQWLSDEVPHIDDGIFRSSVPTFARGLIDRAKLWHQLTPEAWKVVARKYFDCKTTIDPEDDKGELDDLRWDEHENEMKQRYVRLMHRLFAILDEELASVSRET